MDVETINKLVSSIVGLIAIITAVVKVVQYFQERKKKSRLNNSLVANKSEQLYVSLPPHDQFSGRTHEINQVISALKGQSRLVCIEGVGGIGKSSLSREVAYCLIDENKNKTTKKDEHLFCGYIWISANNQVLNSLLDTIAQSLDLPGIISMAGDEKRQAVIRLLREKPSLVIVDNFETVTDPEIEKFLHDLPNPSKALVTSRQIVPLAASITLRGWERDEAIAYIRGEGNRVGLKSLGLANDETLLPIFEYTGGSPLAIRWAIGQIKTGRPIEKVIELIANGKADVYNSLFTQSWSLLSSDTQKCLMIIPLFVSSASLKAIEAASDLKGSALDSAIGKLVELSLLDASDELDIAHRRYTVHPLTRTFALSKLNQKDNLALKATAGMATYYEKFSKEHGGAFDDENYKNLEMEYENLLDIIEKCWDGDRYQSAIEIFDNISQFMSIRGYWTKTLELSEKAMSVCRKHDDSVRAARFQVFPYAWVYRHRGKIAYAAEQDVLALQVLEKSDNFIAALNAKRYVGIDAAEQGDFSKAEAILEDVLTSYKETELFRFTASTIAHLAQVKLQLNKPDEAWQICNEALPISESKNDFERIASLSSVLGDIALMRGIKSQAKKYWEKALVCSRNANRPDGIAKCLVKLAGLEKSWWEKRSARAKLLEARNLYRLLALDQEVLAIDEQLLNI